MRSLFAPFTLAFTLAAYAGAPLVLLPEDPQAETVAKAWRPHLAKAAGVDVRLFSEVTRGLPSVVEPAPADTATGLIGALEGATRGYYYHQDRKVAGQRIDASIQAALSLLPRLVERAKLWDAVRRAQLLLATGAMQAQNDAEVGARCRAVLARDLEWNPPGADFAPPVRKRFEEEKQRALANTATLRIAAPEGTRVFVGGLERGTGTIEVKVPVGPVAVQGYEGGVLEAERVVEATQQGIAVELAPYCASAQHLRLPRCEAPLRKVLGEARVVRLRATTTLTLADASSTRATTLPVRLEATWLAQLSDWFLGRRVAPPELVDRLAVRKPIYKRWWFWTLLGAAVAGTVTAIVVAPRGGNVFEPQVAITGLRWR